jgi:hypothetical protein
MTDQPTNRKVPVVQRDNFTLYLERSFGQTFIHCDIHGAWTKNVMRELSLAFDCLKCLHREPIYALHDPDDNKHLKFIQTFGFKFVETFTDVGTGQTKQMFKT